MENNKELIKKWGENTAYAAKCHFKMSDFNRYWIYTLVLVNVVFAIFSLLEFGDQYQVFTKVFSIASLIASILILVHESQVSNRTTLTHKEVGEAYLAIHYDLEKLFFQSQVNNKEVENQKEKIKELNQKPKPSVSFIAKRWAEKAIEKKGEMHKWWKDE